MAMGLLGGLSGMGFCHMCNTPFCQHTMGGLGAQQQMSQFQLQEHYNNMMRQANNLSVANAGTISITSGSISIPTTHVMQEAVSTKKPNKKLLLLQR